jgi:hypothetical protein
VSVDETAHIDVLTTSDAGAANALDEAIDQATKIAMWLEATCN